MKKLMITAAAFMMAVAAYGQGSFLFNTRDIAAGNNVTFTFNGAAATGSDLWVEILAGKDASSLSQVGTLMPLNRAGTGAGYTQPFSQIINITDPTMVTGATAGAGGTVVVGYQAFQGTTLATASAKSALQMVTGPVSLAVAPATPGEVALGVATVAIVPEPAALALGLIGLGGLLAIRRRK
jgi:hypothetical protein